MRNLKRLRRATSKRSLLYCLHAQKYDLPVTLGQEDGEGTIWTHEMVSLYLGGTDHVDPTDYWTETANDYFRTDYDVKDFVELVQAYYNAC